MSQQVMQRPFARKLSPEEIRQQKVTALAKNIVSALERSRLGGVLYASDYETLLSILALDAGLGHRSTFMTHRHQPTRAADKRTGRSKYRQGDNQSLMNEAVQLGLRQKSFYRHDETEDNGRRTTRVSLYLRVSEPRKWTVFFAEADRIVSNYIPTDHDLTLLHQAVDNETIYTDDPILNSRHSAQIRGWGEHPNLL